MNKTSERLKYILEEPEVQCSDKLLEIEFKCYFSKYLYLILKQRLSYIDWKDNKGSYKLALPVEVNIGRLIKEYKVCRNIFRRAIKELISVGLIEKVTWITPSHSACFVVLVHNDALIASYNPDSHIVAYTKTLSFNFADEELQ